jgi:hypothetical protein
VLNICAANGINVVKQNILQDLLEPFATIPMGTAGENKSISTQHCSHRNPKSFSLMLN